MFSFYSMFINFFVKLRGGVLAALFFLAPIYGSAEGEWQYFDAEEYSPEAFTPKGWNPKKGKISRYRFRFLTNDLNAVDGRPVFSKSGKSIVFMRQPDDGNPAARALLYVVKANGKKGAKLLLDANDPVTGDPLNATRPDYSWKRKSYQVAFDAVGSGIWLLDVKTRKVKQVLSNSIGVDSYTWSYPAWFPDGKHLSITNYNSYGEPYYHELVKIDVNRFNQFSPLTSNLAVWVGESSVNQKNKNVLAFAGQLPVTQPFDQGSCTCPGGCLEDGYAQNCNQIWAQSGTTVAPIDNMQGRAPWFSPNGKYIVFESNRANPGEPDRYRLFVYSMRDKSYTIVTPPTLNVQHAKWSPDGKKLAFAVQLVGRAQGIAVVELD